MVVNADLEQALDPLLDPRSDCDAIVLERSFVPCSWNDVAVLLHNYLPSSRDPDNGITPPVVTARQVNGQLLKTTPCDEETTVLLGPL